MLLCSPSWSWGAVVPGRCAPGPSSSGSSRGGLARVRDAASCAATLPAGQVAAHAPCRGAGRFGWLQDRGDAARGWLRGLRRRAVAANAPGAGGDGDRGGRTVAPAPGAPRPALRHPGGRRACGGCSDRAGVSDRLRTGIHEVAGRLFGRRAPLVDALVVGRRGDLDRELLENFAAAGLVHLLSISGFHLGVLAGWVFVLLRLGGVGRERAGFAAAAFAVAYTVFLGWPAPAARAAALIVILADRAQPTADAPGAAPSSGTTALVVLLFDPWAVLDLGGWLSIAALWGAVTFSAWSPRRLGNGGVTAHPRHIASAPPSRPRRSRRPRSAPWRSSGSGSTWWRSPWPRSWCRRSWRASPSARCRCRWPPRSRPGSGLGLGVLQEIARWGAVVPGGASRRSRAAGVGDSLGRAARRRALEPAPDDSRARPPAGWAGWAWWRSGAGSSSRAYRPSGFDLTRGRNWRYIFSMWGRATPPPFGRPVGAGSSWTAGRRGPPPTRAAAWWCRSSGATGCGGWRRWCSPTRMPTTSEDFRRSSTGFRPAR